MVSRLWPYSTMAKVCSNSLPAFMLNTNYITYMLYLAGFTVLEVKTALYILKGLTNKEIAEIEKVTEFSIKNRMTEIYKKLGIKTKSQLIVKLHNMKYGDIKDV